MLGREKRERNFARGMEGSRMEKERTLEAWVGWRSMREIGVKWERRERERETTQPRGTQQALLLLRLAAAGAGSPFVVARPTSVLSVAWTVSRPTSHDIRSFVRLSPTTVAYNALVPSVNHNTNNTKQKNLHRCCPS